MRFLTILFLLIYFPVASASEENTITPNQAKNILYLKQELFEGKLDNYDNNTFGQFVSDAALKLLAEEQLHTIASGISRGVKLFPKRREEFVKIFLFAAYKELDKESKYELVGLFLGEKDNDLSYYFDDLEVQDLAMQAYLTFLENDGIFVDQVVSDYYKYTRLLDTHPYLTGEIAQHINSQ